MKSVVEQSLERQKQIWKDLLEDSQVKARRQSISLLGADRIILTGLGSSLHAAEFTAYALRQAKGFEEREVLAVSAMHLSQYRLRQGDLCIAVTHRGSPGPTLEALKFAKSRGSKTAVTVSKDVKFGNELGPVLATTEIEKVEPHTFSLTGAVLATTTALSPDVFVPLWKKEVERANPTLSQLSSQQKTSPTVLLGEGIGETLAKEAHLKLIEMASVVARPYSSEHYFHGPHFAHEASDKMWWFDTKNDPRKTRIKAIQQWTVDESSPLGFLDTLVSLQWNALALALNLKQNPDEVKVGI